MRRITDGSIRPNQSHQFHPWPIQHIELHRFLFAHSSINYFVRSATICLIRSTASLIASSEFAYDIRR